MISPILPGELIYHGYANDDDDSERRGIVIDPTLSGGQILVQFEGEDPMYCYPHKLYRLQGKAKERLMRRLSGISATPK